LITNCITDYINFRVENTQTVRCFSNNKPWINPDIKALLKEKKRAFKLGNKDELKAVQRLLRRKIRKGKNSYRKKMEDQLQQKNTSGVWRGLKTISGFKKPDSQAVEDQKWANDLNVFFNRFDQPSAPPPAQSSMLQPSFSAPRTHDPCSFFTSSFHSTTLSSQPPPLLSSLTQPPHPHPPTQPPLLQPVLHNKPGEKPVPEDQGKKSHRSRRHQFQAPQVLCRSDV